MKIFEQKKIALTLSLAFIGFLVWSSVQFQHFFVRILPYFERIAHENRLLSLAVFFGLAILSTTIFSSFSSIPLVPIAIVVWGPFPTFLYLFSGWMIGDFIAYSVGYWAGNPVFKRFVPFEKIEFYRQRIPPNAELKLVFFFIMSLPAEIPNYTLGILRYSFWRYILIAFLAEIIYAYATVFAGEKLIEGNFVMFIGIIVFFTFFFSYFFYLFHRYLRKPAT
jgi:uncharacterized membrane protein YdjX (TVP38/TMEM64 family)